MDTAPGELLAEGRTAEIRAWKHGMVLKLFRDWVNQDAVEYEARIAWAIERAGLAAPRVGRMIELDGRFGLEYERLDGPSMWETLRHRPWTVLHMARLLAEQHVQIHSSPAPPELPSLHEKVERKVRGAQGLSEPVRQAALDALKNLPSGDRLCHGDFHPGNILLTKKGPVVIDWIDASAGSPHADRARTSILALGFVETANRRAILQAALIGWLHKAYLNRYTALLPGGVEEYRAWLPVVAAGRMAEGIEELQPWLASQAQVTFRQRA